MATQRTSINVDAQLWRRFKALLAMEGRDMSPVIEQWIREYVEAHEPLAHVNQVLEETDRQ
jgi:metal-responsive CopG/Arc/MetJ family transcriptional regulator